jgi:hypothetical protein
VIAVEQVSVGLESSETIFGRVTRHARIGTDCIEVVHEIGFAHGRNISECFLGERLRIDIWQSLSVPGRMCLGMSYQLA